MTSVEVSSLLPAEESGSSPPPANGRVERMYPNNQVIFVGKGNPAPSKYIVIPKQLEDDVELFTENYLIKGMGSEDPESAFLPTKPGVLISVTGGAQDFYMHSSKLEQVFNRGLLKAAQNISAWIVDGGLDAGVMQYVGKAIKDMAVEDVPCIGIASHKMVVMHELLTEKGFDTMPAEYVANEPNTGMKCALNPNHTHFILVDSPEAKWAQEILFRSRWEKFIRDRFQVPVVLIVVNGGPGTLETVAQAAENNFAIVVVQGSGRASDAVAALVEKANKASKENDKIAVNHTCASLMTIQNDGVDASPWLSLLNEAKGNHENMEKWTKYMNRILANYNAITIFNADDEASADMDIFILRAILSSPGRKLGLQEKLNLGVVWNRDDIVAEVLETEKDSGLSSVEKRQAMNAAFELAIQLDRPKIFAILAENGAQKDSVNLQRLYYYKAVKPYFRRLPAFAQTRRVSTAVASKTSLPLPVEPSEGRSNAVYSKDTPRNRAFLKEAFSQAGHTFLGYHAAFVQKFEANADNNDGITDGMATLSRRKKKITYNEPGAMRVSFTDIMIWAIFVNRMELAKIVWQHTTLPVHSALLACQLYRYLSNHCTNKDTYLENADWFENEALKLMDILSYTDVKEVLVWEWREMGSNTPLDIAQDAKCKKFICHSHVQNYLDDSFYSDQYGKVEPTISTYRIWASIILPVFIYLIYKESENAVKTNVLYFYRLPIVKFWTNTFFYLGFLFVQAYVLCTLKEGDRYSVVEIILWIWVFSLIIDEFHQFIKDRTGHFKYLSNLMDILLLVLHVIYILLRWISYDSSYHRNDLSGSDSLASESAYRDSNEHSIFLAAVNTLIVACIFSWGRLLNAFAISASLGPLYFIIIRLFRDIFVWIFVFIIFAVSFQLGFISITQQAGLDPAEGYPTGTFPVSFFTIIGEYSYAAELLQDTPLGVALLAVYALLAQILLVNLLIAMMGDTYSNVSDNSAEEWKFYRLELMMENQYTSFHPPPTNILIVPFELFFEWREKASKRGIGQEMQPLVLEQRQQTQNKANLDLTRVLKKMRIARDEVIDAEKEEEETSVQNIVTNVHERLRTLANERENDRTFLNKKFADLETTLTAAANQAVASGSGGTVAGLALDRLNETINGLREGNTALVQQNLQIVSMLDRLYAQNAQLAMQIQAQQQQIAVLQQNQPSGSRSRAPTGVRESDRGDRGEGGDGGGAIIP